jgi:hypothetical protein
MGGLRDIGICHHALRHGYCILWVGTDAAELVARCYSIVYDVSGFFRSCLSRLGDIQFFSRQAAASEHRPGVFTPGI